MKDILLLAQKAGEAILAVYKTDFVVELKKDNSPLTQADMKSHNIIVDGLKKTGIPILSEEATAEDYTTRKDWTKLWCIDPLDGTKEFTQKNDDFTVNIALIENNQPTEGIIYVPTTKECYYTYESKAYKHTGNLDKDFTQILTDSQQLPFQDAPNTVVASRSHMNDKTKDYIDSQHFDEIISRGSSIKFCLVAEGKAKAYIRLAPTCEWDTAAGHAIMRAIGKELYVFETKKPLTYNRENLINPGFVVE